MIKDITASELQQWLEKDKEALFILDVRNDDELLKAKFEGAYHIPMSDIFDRLEEVPMDKPIVCMCHHGMRSARAAHFLEQKGYENIYNLEGGIHAVSILDSTIPKY